MTVSASIRCDKDLRDSAAKVAEYYGLDLSSVTRAFWKQMAQTHTIPLDFDYGVHYKKLWETAYKAEVDEHGTVILPNDWEECLD